MFLWEYPAYFYNRKAENLCINRNFRLFLFFEMDCDKLAVEQLFGLINRFTSQVHAQFLEYVFIHTRKDNGRMYFAAFQFFLRAGEKSDLSYIGASGNLFV